LSYCSAGSGDGDLYLLDIYALEKPATRLTYSSGLDFYAVWAPRGSSLAYVAHSERGANIMVIDDIHHPRKSSRAITDWESNQLKPSWSPDAAWLAFYSNHGRTDRSRFDVYVVQAAGGEPFLVARDVLPSERRGPTWSPDGRELIVVKNDANAGDPLVRASVATRTELVIDTGTVNNSEPTVSADEVAGTWKLAFVSQGLRGSDNNAWRRVWAHDLPREPRP
jgi:Tol biopolymer transport system component